MIVVTQEILPGDHHHEVFHNYSNRRFSHHIYGMDGGTIVAVVHGAPNPTLPDTVIAEVHDVPHPGYIERCHLTRCGLHITLDHLPKE